MDEKKKPLKKKKKKKDYANMFGSGTMASSLNPNRSRLSGGRVKPHPTLDQMDRNEGR